LSSGGRRRAVAGIAVAILLLALTLTLAACGARDDPFVGLWWEPTTGRRVEITKDGEKYQLFYGAARRPYQATRVGDELRIRQLLGGDIVVRTAAEGHLEMVIGGTTSRLERVPQHQ
jgi:hypothetical protein